MIVRSQKDDAVRVFVANIVAGGVGITLTAARQVVFNDLDWVPANHWQAEDPEYRVGQTGTVNVSYLVAAGTIDEFAQCALATTAALIEAVMVDRARRRSTATCSASASGGEPPFAAAGDPDGRRERRGSRGPLAA
jgi:SNF2 family DNA or RNA helicase